MTDLRVGHFLLWKRSGNVVQKKLPLINESHGPETRNIINELIKLFNNMGYTYNESLQKAQDILAEAQQTNDMNESVQQQINTLIAESGTSDAEVLQARIDAEGNEYSVVKERLDKENTELKKRVEDNDHQRFTESMINRKKGRKPMITIIDDDGNRGFYTKLRPLAKEYGIVFTSAIITERQHGFPGDERNYYDRYIHYEEMLEMQAEGTGEFVSHTHHHQIDNRPDQMSDAERYEDFKTSQEILKRLGFNHRCVVYPYGTYGEESIKTAKKLFDYAIGTSSRGNHTQIPPFDQYDMLRTSAQYDMNDIKEQIDNARDNNGWVIYTAHVDQGDWYSEEWMREIIEYALDQGLEFVTTEKGMEHHGNIAQFGNNVISSDGQAFGEDFGIKFVHDTSITADTPITDFEPNKVTRARIQGNQGGFPDNISGFLDTFRYTDNVIWSYQIFTTTRDKRIYSRYWDEENNEWSDFVNQSQNVHLGTNAISLSDKPSSPHLARRVVYTNINSSGASGFPENSSGTFIHYGFTLDGFAFQEYHVYQSERVYKRNWDGSSWTEFKLEGGLFMPDSNSFTGVTNRSEFPKGVSISIIRGDVEVKGTPNEQPGTLNTYNIHDIAGFNYQEFIPFNDSLTRSYKRYGSSSGNGWGDFVLVSQSLQ